MGCFENIAVGIVSSSIRFPVSRLQHRPMPPYMSRYLERIAPLRPVDFSAQAFSERLRV